MMRSILMLCFTLVVSCESTQTTIPETMDMFFTSVDAQKKIVMQTGSTFQISMPSNPTTGFHWSVDIEHSEIVQMQSDRYVADRSGRVGVAGESLWIFRANKTGKSNITFSYMRPWKENIKPSKVVTFELDVR